MSTPSERDHLVSMANQIAANFRFHDDAVDRITDHLGRFWAPSLRRQLSEMAAAGDERLDPPVIEAARRLEG